MGLGVMLAVTVPDPRIMRAQQARETARENERAKGLVVPLISRGHE